MTTSTSDAGKLGAAARLEKLTPAQLSKQMRKAIRARWKKYYEDNPEKKKVKGGKK